MKILFSDQWQIRGVLNNKLCFVSIKYPDEWILLPKVKFVNRQTNESYEYSLSGNDIVRRSWMDVMKESGLQACPNDK